MIIGISGKIGCGKTTLTKELSIALAKRTVVTNIRGFGDAVKLEVAQAFDFPVEWGFNEEGKAQLVVVGEAENGNLISEKERCLSSMPYKQTRKSVRELLQWWGTEYRRRQDPDYWVKALFRAAAPDIHMGLTVLIHDVRFLNEYVYIQKLKGILIRVEPYDGWVPGPNANHISETALDEIGSKETHVGGFDYVIKPEYGNLAYWANAVATKMTSWTM